MTDVEKLCQDIFFGRIQMCDKCRKKNQNCTNEDCLRECERILGKDKKEDEQISLF